MFATLGVINEVGGVFRCMEGDVFWKEQDEVFLYRAGKQDR